MGRSTAHAHVSFQPQDRGGHPHCPKKSGGQWGRLQKVALSSGRASVSSMQSRTRLARLSRHSPPFSDPPTPLPLQRESREVEEPQDGKTEPRPGGNPCPSAGATSNSPAGARVSPQPLAAEKRRACPQLSCPLSKRRLRRRATYKEPAAPVCCRPLGPPGVVFIGRCAGKALPEPRPSSA